MEVILTAAALAALLASLITGAVVLTQDRRSRRRPLEGEHVIVNTPKPDDQSLRGFCAEELSRGRLRLTGAVYLETIRERGGERVRPVPAGEVVVPAYSWAQIIPPPALQTEE